MVVAVVADAAAVDTAVVGIVVVTLAAVTRVDILVVGMSVAVTLVAEATVAVAMSAVADTAAVDMAAVEVMVVVADTAAVEAMGAGTAAAHISTCLERPTVDGAATPCTGTITHTTSGIGAPGRRSMAGQTTLAGYTALVFTLSKACIATPTTRLLA